MITLQTGPCKFGRAATDWDVGLETVVSWEGNITASVLPIPIPIPESIP